MKKQKMHKGFLRRELAVSVALLMSSGAAWSLEAVDDNDLASVTGQTGLSVGFSSNSQIGGASSQVQWNPNGLGAASSAALEMNGVQFSAIGTDGATPASPNFLLTNTLDLGGNGAGSNAVSLGMSWTRMRQSIPSIYLANGSSGSLVNSSSSFGSSVIDSSGSFLLTNQGGGILAGGGVSGAAGGTPTFTGVAGRVLTLTLGVPQLGVVSPTDPGAQIYYRQGAVGSPELVMSKIYLETGFSSATGGVFGACGNTTSCGTFASGQAGIYIGAPKLDFNFTYALDYRASPSATQPFTTAANDYTGLAYSGWKGSFDNAELLVAAGGMWPGQSSYSPDNPSGRNQGINFAFHGNYDSNFNWVVGQAGGTAVLEFGNWTTLSGANWALNSPNLTVSVVNPGQGPGGLCWGASVYGTNSGACQTSVTRVYDGLKMTPQFLDVAPGLGAANATSLGIAFRDLSLQAYSTNVTLLDDVDGNGDYTGTVNVNGKSVAETRTFGWGLMYTLGKVDGNIYLYPGNYAQGSTSSSGNGVTLDVLMMSQSTASNSNKLLGNTNFMIADTTKGYGIGLMEANLLFAAHQLNFNLTNSGIELKTNDLRMEVNGRLGGGTVPNLTQQVNLSNLDVNLEGAVDFYLAGANTKTASQDTATNNQYTTFISGTSTPAIDTYTYNNPYTGKPYPYLAFSGTMTLGNSATFGKGCSDPTTMAFSCTDSYVSLGEPSQPGVDVRFADLQGTVKVINGRVFLISQGDPVMAPDQLPRLQIAADVQVGATAGGNPLATNVMMGTLNTSGNFSGNYSALGSIVIPSGQMYSSIILKPQH